MCLKCNILDRADFPSLSVHASVSFYDKSAAVASTCNTGIHLTHTYMCLSLLFCMYEATAVLPSTHTHTQPDRHNESCFARCLIMGL